MNEQDRAIVATIQREFARWVDLTRDLVNCDSGTFNKHEADRAGDILAFQLEHLGFDVERSEQERFGDHVIARRPGRGERRLLFLGHFDTVFPPGTVERRSFALNGEHATGPGIYDMKSGLVILIAALTALRDIGAPVWNDITLTVVFNSDEEVFSPTSRPLIEAEARRADTVCVLEPARPGGEYTYVRKGAGMFRFSVSGRAAHSGSQPHLGRSAVVELARKILLLDEVSRPEVGTTVNVGIVRGGERANVVAQHAECEFDLRVLDTEEAERAQREFGEIAALQFVPDTRTELTGGMMFPPLSSRRCNAYLFQLVQEAGQKLGLELHDVVSGGASDGNTAGQLAPVIDGLGACGNGAHADHEFIRLSSLTERAQVLALFLADWPSHAAAVSRLWGSRGDRSEIE